MKIRLYTFWEQISNSFWFIPALMVVSASILAIAMIILDQSVPPSTNPALSWIYASSPDGARSLLSTIAGSMISVTGVTFSITIVALSLAAAQLGPRLLDNFMRDRGNQIVLGTFVSIFIYCLLILRSIRSSDSLAFVPHLSVSLAMIQALIGVSVLIYFFHHVSTMIQAENVIASIGRELESIIDRLISVEASQRSYEYELRTENDIPSDFDENSHYFKASSNGYLQGIDYEALQKLATDNDLLMRILFRPGDFVAKDSHIIASYPIKELPDSVEDTVSIAFTLGAKRLRIQDVEFAVDQLVEIAVRALSPGVNDPFTAIACINQLGTTLSGLAERTMPSGYYYDKDGNLRLIGETLTFEGVVNAAFNQIRQNGRSDVAVMIRLLEVIAIIIARSTSVEYQDALVRHADMVMRACNDRISEENDRKDLEERYNIITSILEEKNK